MIINWQDFNAPVSKYFTVGEVCNNDRRRLIVPNSTIAKNVRFLALQLDKLRELWGSPIGVTSWYRPPDVNREVGGVWNSQHLTGGAVDVYNHNGDPYDFELFLDKQWADRALGYGVLSGKGFTHLDLRRGRIRWDY